MHWLLVLANSKEKMRKEEPLFNAYALVDVME